MPRIASDLEAAIVASYQGGRPTRDIAEDFGVGVGTIYSALRRSNVKPSRQQRTWNESAVAMYLDGCQLERIEADTGVKPSSIYWHVRAAGHAPNRTRR